MVHQAGNITMLSKPKMLKYKYIILKISYGKHHQFPCADRIPPHGIS